MERSAAAEGAALGQGLVPQGQVPFSAPPFDMEAEAAIVAQMLCTEEALPCFQDDDDDAQGAVPTARLSGESELAADGYADLPSPPDACMAES